ncbi:hypothetical protein ACJMK2_024508 [Sinanodonta woodiana]|uniref:DUF4773 domain-containing protein n=1 Tax=Sinanodonta woodiana TaxID=1069815 RepID=A0ABD3XH71_SINWO
MARISIFIVLVGVLMDITAGLLLQEEMEFRIVDDEEKTALRGDGVIGDFDMDWNKALLEAILRGDISLEELLGQGIIQNLQTKIVDGPLTDSRWSKCLVVNTSILGYKIDFQACLTLEWLSVNMGIRITIQVGSFKYVKEISLSNPPALCYGVPYISALQVCIQFFDINIGNKSGCVRLTISVFSWDIGCFKVVHMGKEERLVQHPHPGHLMDKSETVKKPSSVKIFQE